jgi:hypothetical protein
VKIEWESESGLDKDNLTDLLRLQDMDVDDAHDDFVHCRLQDFDRK